MRAVQVCFALSAIVASLAIVACSSDANSGGTPATDGTTPTESTDPTEPTEGEGEAEGEEGTDAGKKDSGTGGGKDSGTKDSGTKDSGTPPPPPPPTGYTQAQMQSLFQAKCNGCHIVNSSAGLNLGAPFTTKTIGVGSSQAAMPLITAGDHTKSYLFHKLAGTHASVGGSGVRMPRNGTALTSTELADVAGYIDSL